MEALPGFREMIENADREAKLYPVFKLTPTILDKRCNNRLLLDSLSEKLQRSDIKSCKQSTQDILLYSLYLALVSLILTAMLVGVGGADGSRPFEEIVILLLNLLFFILGIIGVCVLVTMFYAHFHHIEDRSGYEDVLEEV